MASKNLVILIGNTGAEPEIKDANGLKIASLSLCTTERGYTKKDGTKVEDRSEWHRLKAFGKTAETIEKYVHKGTSLYVEGRLHYDSYEKDGSKVYTTDIIIESFQFLGGKAENNSNANKTQSPNTSSVSDNDALPF